MTVGVLAQEVFAALLMQTVVNLAAAEANKGKQSKCDITVADIIGLASQSSSGFGLLFQPLYLDFPRDHHPKTMLCASQTKTVEPKHLMKCSI